MERKTTSITKELRESHLHIPTEGILLHGTSQNRAESIKMHGFNPTLARGDTLDPFASHFFYYNPDPIFINSSLLWIVRRNVGMLIDYAQWSARNDLSEGTSKPAIVLLEKPKEFIIPEETILNSKRVPVMVSTHEHIPPDTIIDIIDLGENITLQQTITRREEHIVIKKVWECLEAKYFSELQLPDQE